jgi:hypothetical protein
MDLKAPTVKSWERLKRVTKYLKAVIHEGVRSRRGTHRASSSCRRTAIGPGANGHARAHLALLSSVAGALCTPSPSARASTARVPARPSSTAP